MESSSAIRLYVQKNFAVPPARLFEAWSREEDLKEWWHPLGHRLERVTNELREGGRVRYEFRTTNGGPALYIDGEYQEVKGKEKLVYTWNWKMEALGGSNAEYLLEVRFLPQDKGSRLEVMQENFSDEEVVQPHKEGWEKALRDLKSYLEKK